MWFNGKAIGPWSVLAGVLVMAFMMSLWFGKVIEESEGGLYTNRVDVSYRWSMSWFIFSEVIGLLRIKLSVKGVRLPHFVFVPESTEDKLSEMMKTMLGLGRAPAGVWAGSSKASMANPAPSTIRAWPKTPRRAWSPGQRRRGARGDGTENGRVMATKGLVGCGRIPAVCRIRIAPRPAPPFSRHA